MSNDAPSPYCQSLHLANLIKAAAYLIDEKRDEEAQSVLYAAAELANTLSESLEDAPHE